MGDKYIMSKKELERKSLLEAVESGRLLLMEAAKKMEVSYRQSKRIWKRYQEEKDAGLCHRNRGKRPNNAYSDTFKEEVLKRYQERYDTFGPTFAAEKLEEDDKIQVNAETLRLWLKAAGLWQRKRKHKIYRERRERRPAFGDLLQIDGSIHSWFEEQHHCLLNMVDDATGICLAQLDKGETTQILLSTFLQWVKLYGIPKAVYVDLKSVYVSPKRLKEKYDDDLLIQESFSVFEQVCKRLNVEIIRAYSPQAKGRVERKHAVFQDRFVKELKLYNIHTLDAANKHLKKFLVKINQKFAHAQSSVPDGHREAHSYGDLKQIFCWQYKRQLRHDWTIQFKRAYYQVNKGYEHLLKPEDFILIKRYLDGSMCFWFKETELVYKALSSKPEPPSRTKQYYKRKNLTLEELAKKRARKPKPNHPWKAFHSESLKT